ncbi:hypothetical protein YB2330_004728 [Saitoella coloradoensis]
MSTPANKSIAIVIYSMYGHIATMAEAVKAGIEKAGSEAVIYQVPETLPQEVLTKMHAPGKRDYPIATIETLESHSAFIFGIPTRFGNFPAQFKAFFDQTGGLWATGALAGKLAGVFVSTASPGGGQESTAMNAMSTFAHHGMIYVPLGYSRTFAQLTNLEEVHGGSAWGAGTFAGGDGSRMPSALELEVAGIQGESFAQYAQLAEEKKEQVVTKKLDDLNLGEPVVVSSEGAALRSEPVAVETVAEPYVVEPVVAKAPEPVAAAPAVVPVAAPAPAPAPVQTETRPRAESTGQMKTTMRDTAPTQEKEKKGGVCGLKCEVM